MSQDSWICSLGYLHEYSISSSCLIITKGHVNVSRRLPASWFYNYDFTKIVNVFLLVQPIDLSRRSRPYRLRSRFPIFAFRIYVNFHRWITKGTTIRKRLVCMWEGRVFKLCEAFQQMTFEHKKSIEVIS